MAAVPHLRPSFLLSLFLILFLFPSSSEADPAALSQADALLTLKKALNNPRKLRSWDEKIPPCAENKLSKWAGVVCFHGSVTGIHLSHMGLSGFIDIDALTALPTLRTISLIDNKFDGDMPEFNRLGALKALYLTGNRFSGEIPSDFFSEMTSLKKVWLAGNEFRGPIPTSLSKLPHLRELHLEQNHFSGVIPDFSATPLLRSFDVSGNRLQGSIPESLGKFDAKAFEGNTDLCGPQVEKECPGAMAASVAMGEENKGSRSMALVITMMILLVCMLGILVVVALKKREDDFDMLGRDVEEDGVTVHMESHHRKDASVRKDSHHSRRGAVGVTDLVMVNEDRGVFGLPDLMKAAAEVLGTGGLGSAYKAVMANGVAVVVKRMREMNRVGNEGFDAEMKRLGALRHRNVLPPLAYHFRKEEKLLVYEFVPKGSLLYLLHGDRGPGHAELDWPARLKIVRGVGRGMGFLHSELPNSELPHGNLKSSNILLGGGPDFEPLLADFGFYPLVQPTEASNVMFAYKSPECLRYRHLSPKSDVYCLGIVILEILTGKFPSQYLNHGKGGTDVVQWVGTAIAEKRVTEVLDPEIAGSCSSENNRTAMERLLGIGAGCADPNVESRPDMNTATEKIEAVASEWESKNDGAPDQQLLICPAPSLKEDYGDMPGKAPAPTPAGTQSHAANVLEGLGEAAGQRSGRENFGNHPSLRRNGESSAFDIS